MTIEAGQQLLHYRLIEQIGEGGMGVVWKAVDTKLEREIAIKIIPDAFAGQPDRMARFEREAKLLASLDHPNIATIHGLHEADGMRFLAMELVEGEDLSQRLSRGAMPLTEAFEAAKQIADALASAHSNGIVHRDLKPANVRITPRGKVKVLDFGLAKVWEESSADGNLTHSPTLTAQMTQAGMILGTASYMSPEQARGHDVDKRTDVWAFGCVLLEMLSGQQVFGGATVTDVIASVVAREPRWESLPGGTPPSIRRLLQRCLKKEAEQRLNDIGDARLILEEVLETGGAEELAEAADAPARKRRERLWMAVAALLAVATTSLAVLFWQSSSGTPQIIRAYITAPPGGSFYVDPVDPGPATLSPDGTKIAYSIREPDGSIRLWVRDVDEVEARPLRGTEFAEYPFWSPDSRMIAFFTQSKLKKIEAAGGPPVTLCDAPNGKGGTWNRDGVIVFTQAHNTPLSRVSSAGGDPATITEIDREAGENSHRHPRFLPDGRHVIYLARQTAASETGGHAVRLLDLESGEDRELFRADSNVEYSRDHLFFLRDTTLMARSFSAKRRELRGDPFPVAENLIFVPGAALGIFSLSGQGTLVYQTGDVQAMGTTLEWVDRAGGSAGRLAEEDRHYQIDLSPDGRSVAVSITDTQRGTNDVWIYDVERKIKSRFTFDPANDEAPSWSPDGSVLAFTSDRGADFGLFVKPVEGGGEEQLLLEGEDVAYFPQAWSPDGKHLVFSSVGTQRDIGAMVVNPPGEPFLIQPSSFDETYPAVSPDGRWLAYVSDESGREEVYLTLFPDGGRKWQVSEDGGNFPRWSADRQKIHYLEPDGTLIVADLEIAGSTLTVLGTTELFVTGRRAAPAMNYDVTADGERFLISKAAPGQDLPPLTLVVNWKP